MNALEKMEAYRDLPMREFLDNLRELNGKDSCIANYGNLARSNASVQNALNHKAIIMANDDFHDLEDIE